MRRNAYWRMFGLEVRRTLRDPATWGGLFAVTLILLIGAWLYWRALPPRPDNGRLFGEALLLAAIIAWHAGLARDRSSKFDVYLAANFVEPAVLFFAKVSTALAFITALCGIAFVLALATSAGDIGYAANYAGIFLLGSFLALPLLVLIELGLNTRYPLAILLLLFFAFLGIYSRVADVQALVRTLGMAGNIQVVPALLRTFIALALTAACYPLFRRRLGGRRLAAILNPS